MNEPATNTCIFSPEINSYLQANEFFRIDDCDDKSAMTWQRGNTILQFNSNEISVLAIVDGCVPEEIFYMYGFLPHDSVLFAFLMHSWQIILLHEAASVAEKNNLTKNFKHIIYN